jgi:hypothetical protein
VPNNGASQFNICLGVEDLGHPDGVGATPWTTKDGTLAVPRDATTPNYGPGVKLFWGVLPDCPNQGTSRGPCVLSKHKDNAGDEVITFFQPSPWDGTHLGF